MKKIILICVFTLSNFLISAQTPDTLWTKFFGGNDEDICFSICQTTDGGYAATGQYKRYGDIWLVRTNSLGDTLWTKTYGGIYADRGHCIQQTIDGGFIITGITDWNLNPNTGQICLIKADSVGTIQWQKSFGEDGNWDSAKEVQITSDSGYIIVGTIMSYELSQSFIYLIKTNSTGDTMWTKKCNSSGVVSGESIKQTSDGGYIIAANKSSSSGYDLWLIKTNVSGDTIWTKTIGGEDREEGFDLQITKDGDFVIVGRKITGQQFIWMVKTDSEGNIIFTKEFNKGVCVGRSIYPTSDDGFIIAGKSADPIVTNLIVLKTDSFGNEIWTYLNATGYDAQANSVKQTSDGGYIVAGSYYTAPTDHNFWLLKLDKDPLVNVEAESVSVLSFNLVQNFPNPFNPSTKISYAIPQNALVELKVFNLLGQEIATLVNEEKDQGVYTVNFDANNLASGLYLYRIQAGSFIDTKKMVLMK